VNPMPAAAAVSTGAMVLRVVLALGLVLGIFAAVLYLYRRATRSGAAPRRQQRIEILAQRSLGTRTSLALVQVAGETLLIGVTPQQITALGPVSLETDAEAMRALVMAPEPQREFETSAGEAATAPARALRPARRALATAAAALAPADVRFAQTLQTELTRVRRAIGAPAPRPVATHAPRTEDPRAVEV
jgi:flagellar biosynthetic protein FliO